MCGISGYISKKNLIADNCIERTLEMMKRRGPDSKNFFKKSYNSKQLALLHSRLNIIDLNERANQPYHDEDFIIVFNGEIYNYLEIKSKLENKNYKFKTNSDTEVLIKSFQEYGEKCVDHFIGMWAFAIWDIKKKQLFLSRDPFGEKPLYYFFDQNGFFFGSEIKFIKSLCKKNFGINKNQIQKNIFLGYKSLNKSNSTFYKDIISLESSSNILIDLDLNLIKKKYWRPKLNIDQNMSLNDAVSGVKLKLTKSLELRMRSDVPIAFCLSGGVDSALLASHAKKTFDKKISTFSIIDKDPRYDESENLRYTINDLKCKHELIKINNSEDIFFDRLKMLTEYHDGPIATLSYYIHSFLSENISKNDYRVAISGTGADELFTGYYDHFLLHFEALKGTKYLESNIEYWNKFILPKIRNPYLQNSKLYIEDPENRDLVYEKNLGVSQYSVNAFEHKFTEENYCDELLRKRMMNELFHEVVPVILKHDDLNSMYYSIENRSPYLDRDLLEFTLTIPPHLLIANGLQKKILRDSGEGVLNDQVRLSKQKKGFNASINSIINFDNSNLIDLIFDTSSPIAEYVDLVKLKKDLNIELIPNHLSKLIFSIISTNFFLESNK
jgi:asparagine synthase (glutamine-hydrolysing)